MEFIRSKLSIFSTHVPGSMCHSRGSDTTPPLPEGVAPAHTVTPPAGAAADMPPQMTFPVPVSVPPLDLPRGDVISGAGLTNSRPRPRLLY